MAHGTYMANEEAEVKAVQSFESLQGRKNCIIYVFTRIVEE